MNNNKDFYRIEVNFDLSMKLLDKYYPGGRANRKAAYNEISTYFKEKGFTHPLFSGYQSESFYTDSSISEFINDFFDTIKWAEKCMKECHITIVENEIIDALQL